MNPVDLGIIVAYIVGCTLLGSWLGSSAKGLKGYFLGESNIPAWAVMISIVATETSTATFLSVPSIAYKGDFRFLQLAIGYLFGRLVVSTVLLPMYFKGEIYTAYEVLDQRFGGATKTLAAVLFLVTRTLGDGLRLFLAAVVMRDLSGWDLPASIVVMGTATIIYTYLGGMKGVIWTDVIQFFIYMAGALVALWILVHRIDGGWEALVSRGAAAGKFRMFDFTFDLTLPYSFWAGAVGGMILNTATHGADQIMVQRYLSARSERQAAGALMASGLVVFAQFALFLLIGVALWAFYQDHPPALPLGRDGEFSSFIAHELPTGILGLVVAAIFSAAMSTLSSSLNASASATINDLYRPLHPGASEAHLLRLSKAMTAAWGLAQMGVAFGAIGLNDNVVSLALKIASFVTGIILGLFLLGVWTTRVGQASALVGFVAGLAAVSYAAFGTALAWPWYALVGSSTVVLVGLAASYVLPPWSPTAASSTPKS
ncbi:sodium:solute symporter [Isosphaeraceae bacterium EP7]